MIKAILFDFNGVIIDDEPVQMKAYQEVLKEEGIVLTEEGYLACLGMNDEVFLRTIYERAGKEVSFEQLPELIEAKTDKWKGFFDKQIPLFDGIEDFIKRMETKFTLGLVSMARLPEIDYVLEETGLKKSFSAIVSAEDVSSIKPEPECYKKGFRMIDKARTAVGKVPLLRRQCVVIEDSPPGIIAGKRAGLKTLGVTSTVDAKALRDAGALAVTNNLDDWYHETFNGVFN